MTADPRDVVLRPVVSEKSFAEAERGKYVFLVDRTATKPEIRRAVEQIWGVHVRKVNTMRRRGKTVRRRWLRGKRSDTRRAVVTLAPGDQIELFGGG